MELEMLIKDIEQLILFIDSVYERNDSYAIFMVYDLYEKIISSIKNTYIIKTAIRRDEYIEYMKINNYDTLYKMLQMSLSQIKDKAQIFDKHEDSTLVKPCFDKIQRAVIKEIENTKYLIWIAVAWFTDSSIFNALIDAKNRGINIQVITLNHSNNKNNDGSYKLNFTNNNIEVKYTNNYEFGNTNLHDKFCVFDLEKVMHGSYNWTYTAQKNMEDICIINDRGVAKEFADRFIYFKKTY